MYDLQLYEDYKDQIIWAAVPGLIVILLTVIMGFFGNTCIILATIKTK